MLKHGMSFGATIRVMNSDESRLGRFGNDLVGACFVLAVAVGVLAASAFALLAWAVDEYLLATVVVVGTAVCVVLLGRLSAKSLVVAIAAVAFVDVLAAGATAVYISAGFESDVDAVDPQGVRHPIPDPASA